MNDFYTAVLTTSLFILIFLLLRALFFKKISMRLQYALWLLAALKLLVFPVPRLESRLSALNLYPAAQALSESGTDAAQAKQDPAAENTQASSAAPPAETQTKTPAAKALPSHKNTQTGSSRDTQAVSGQTGTDSPFLFGKARISVFLPYLAAAGSLGLFLYFLCGHLLLTRYLRRHRIRFPAENSALPVYLCNGLPAPCLFGKAVYLPPDLTSDQQKLDCILAHEYCHYRQGDLLWSWLRCLCTACWWFHPLVWLAAYLSKQDCELACDEAALKLLGETQRLSYGRTLISLIPVRTDQPHLFSTALTVTGGRNMKQRIKRIAARQKNALPACILAAFLSVLCFISISTSRPSAKAETPQDTPAQTNRTADASAGSSRQAASADSHGLQDAAADTSAGSSGQDASAGSHGLQDAAADASQTDAVPPVLSLDDAVSQAILTYNKDKYMETECAGEGHLILTDPLYDNVRSDPDAPHTKSSEKLADTAASDAVTVYALTMYGGYQFQNGNFVKAAGSGIIPAVMEFSYSQENGYVLNSYQEPDHGSRYIPSIQKMFPEEFWEICISGSEKYDKDLQKQEQAYAGHYLEKIGRDAKIGESADFSYPLLTDQGISIDVSNQLSEDKRLANYPYWTGTLERMENGVRYVYELRLKRENKDIIFEKREFDTNVIVERFYFDAASGRDHGSFEITNRGTAAP